VPPGATRLGALSELGARGVEGLIFSYELFDAMPVHRLIGRAGGATGERWGDWRERDGFLYVEGDLSDPALLALLGGRRLVEGQIADLAPAWEPLYRELARALERGLIVTCDYGYERDSLLDLRVRRHGTLACYSRQRVHRDALRRLGEEDLTAHVDWTTLREAGEAEGLESVVLTRQARWLVAAGLFEEIAAAGAAAASAARTLLDGDGMGEEIRVLVQSRGVRASQALDLDILGRDDPG
jgi:SAM-dependent MidA family methyltransferase